MKCYALTNDVKPRKKKKNLFLNSRKLLNEIHAMQCWGWGLNVNRILYFICMIPLKKKKAPFRYLSDSVKSFLLIIHIIYSIQFTIVH